MSNEVAEQNLSAKAKWADQIQQSLNEGDYSKAKVLAQKALGEFPNDADLLALEEEAIHARERSAQAHQLMEEGCQLFDDGAFEEAVQVLRNGFALDERSKAIRSALLNCLVRYATEMMKTDLHKARNVVQEAMCIEPENPAVTRLIDEVRKARPATPVDQNASSSERISEAKTPAVVPLMREKAVQAKSATAEPAPGGCAADIQSKRRPAVPGMAPRTPAMPQQKTGNIVHEKNMPAAPPAGAPKLGTTSEPASDTKQTAQVPLPLPPPPKKMQFNVTGILSKTGSAAITPAPAKNSGEPAPAAVVAAPLAGSAPASALSSQPIASALPSTQSNAAETRVTAPDSPVAAEKVPNAAESPAVQPAPQAKAQEKALR